MRELSGTGQRALTVPFHLYYSSLKSPLLFSLPPVAPRRSVRPVVANLEEAKALARQVSGGVEEGLGSMARGAYIHTHTHTHTHEHTCSFSVQVKQSKNFFQTREDGSGWVSLEQVS